MLDKETALFLYNHPPFNLLPFDRVEQITDQLKTQIFPVGHDILVHNGEPSQYLYIIRKGSADVLREDEQGVMHVIDMLSEGDAFGHLSLAKERLPSATVRTREETLVYLLPPEEFDQLRNEEPAFGKLFEASSLEHLNQVFHTQRALEQQDLRTHLNELLEHPLIFVAPEMSVAQAAQIMRENKVDCLMVDTTPPGILTERDLRDRILAERRSYETPVSAVMTSPIETLPADSTIFEGLLFMLGHHIRHLPVTEGTQIIGVITNTDILRQQSQSPLFLPWQLKKARTNEDMGKYTAQVSETVGALIRSGARVQDIGRIVAIAYDALLDRMLRDAEADMGPPPCPYAWLVLGSEGRYEQTLHTDQDSALIYADDAPPEAAAYFEALAKRMVKQLFDCGFPYCSGDIMATNPQWRQPLQVWKGYFNDWIHVPDEEALMRVGIFFDYRRVYGTLAVENELRPIIQRCSKNGLFLAHLSKGALRQSPPLGFFRNLVLEHDGEGRDVIDLKVRGTALIVDLARLFALSVGCTETNTITRLQVAAHYGDLSKTGADELIAAFEHINRLRLRNQYEQMQNDEEVSNLVQVAWLTSLERRELKGALKAIGNIQRSVSLRFGVT